MKTITRSISLANELAEKIRQRIQAEQLPDGAFFMTEAQLAEEYGVSRTVAREAARSLQALGILEGRKRKGLMIRRPDPLLLLSNSLPSLISSPQDWQELAQLRYVIEVGAIELAVRSATEAQVEQLGKIAAEMERVLINHEGVAREIALDLEFHALILQMTGSRMIAGMQQVLVQFFQISPHLEPDDATAERVAWEHRELYNAIRDRDVERARAMIRLQFRKLVPVG